MPRWVVHVVELLCDEILPPVLLVFIRVLAQGRKLDIRV